MPLVTCPCDAMAPMKLVRRDGVEIDVCTQCRGVWLDRGELEKLLAAVQREADADATSPVQGARPPVPPSVPPSADGAYRAPPPWGGERGERGEHGERGAYGQDWRGPRHDGQHGRKKRFDIFEIFD